MRKRNMRKSYLCLEGLTLALLFPDQLVCGHAKAYDAHSYLELL